MWQHDHSGRTARTADFVRDEFSMTCPRAAGFTLIELLVVISIIALLISILLPALARARDIGRRTTCATQQRQILIGLHSYATDRNGAAPSLINDNFRIAYSYMLRHESNRPGFTGFPFGGLGLIYAEGYVNDLTMFHCPKADQTGVLEELPSFFGSYNYRIAHPIDGFGVHRQQLSEHRTVRPGEDEGDWETFLRGQALLADIFTQHPLRGGRPNWFWHSQQGINVGYRDGSSRWYADSDGEIWGRKYPGSNFNAWVREIYMSKLDRN